MIESSHIKKKGGITLSKPELEFKHYRDFKAEKLPLEGLSHRMIAKVPGTAADVGTRVLEFEPGTDTSSEGVKAHDYWEEVYIMEGSIIDLELNQEFTEGMIAVRPPGMKHGPWISPNGCKTFEVRYYTKD